MLVLITNWHNLIFNVGRVWQLAQSPWKFKVRLSRARTSPPQHPAAARSEQFPWESRKNSGRWAQPTFPTSHPGEAPDPGPPQEPRSPPHSRTWRTWREWGLLVLHPLSTLKTTAAKQEQERSGVVAAPTAARWRKGLRVSLQSWFLWCQLCHQPAVTLTRPLCQFPVTVKNEGVGLGVGLGD